MTRGAKKAAWIFGLLAGAAGIGGAVYYFTRPKKEDLLRNGLPKSNLPPPDSGSTTVPSFDQPFSPYAYAAIPQLPSYVPAPGGGGGLITATGKG